MSEFQYECPEWSEDNREPFWDDNSEAVEDWIYDQTPEETEKVLKGEDCKTYWQWVNDGFGNEGEYMMGHHEVLTANGWERVDRNDYIVYNEETKSFSVRKA